LEELGQNSAVFLVRLRIDVVQAHLTFSSTRVRDNINGKTHDAERKGRLQGSRKGKGFIERYAGGDIGLGLAQGFGADLESSSAYVQEPQFSRLTLENSRANSVSFGIWMSLSAEQFSNVSSSITTYLNIDHELEIRHCWWFKMLIRR
jgi:hypothetical protein